jgi:hypothetical protein
LQRGGYACRKIRAQRGDALLLHAVAGQMPSLPATGEFFLALQATEQETSGIGVEFAVEKGGQLLFDVFGHGRAR